MLKIEQLCAGYGRSDVIRDIDLRVPAGQLVCLIGSNGAGKSTIMRAISGMIRPTAGEIILGGRNITNMPSNEVASCGLAHVPEGRRIFPSLSVMNNLRLGAYRRKEASAADVAREIDHVMEIFPRLRERSRQYAGTLSGGEQQMLAVGRALMGAPSIILLDEPSMAWRQSLSTKSIPLSGDCGPKAARCCLSSNSPMSRSTLPISPMSSKTVGSSCRGRPATF